MNSQSHFNPNNGNQSHYSSPNATNFRGRNRLNTPSPSWGSPPWRPRQNFSPHNHSNYGYNGGPRNNYRMNNFSSPRNGDSPSYKRGNSRTSTPDRNPSANNSFNNSSDSGFVPLPFSPYPDHFRSPPYRKRGGWSRGRPSFDRSHSKEPIEVYFKRSMLENPWKHLEPTEKSTNPDANKT